MGDDVTIREWRMTGDEAVRSHESTNHLPSCVVVTGASADDVRAGLAALRIIDRGYSVAADPATNPSFIRAKARMRGASTTVFADSITAAVLALAAAIEEADRG